MSNTYHADQSFMRLISDAIYFYRLSVETEDQYETQRFARTSILNSALTIEAAANCCLYHADGAKQFIDEMERTTSFTKLDVFSKFHNDKFIDRSIDKFQRVAELKKVRDSFVHPKKTKVPIEFAIDEEKYKDHTELNILFEGKRYQATKIERSPMLWFSNDARFALESILAFYDYYFIELLELEHKEVIALIGDAIFIDKKICWSFHPETLENDRKHPVKAVYSL